MNSSVAKRTLFLTLKNNTSRHAKRIIGSAVENVGGASIQRVMAERRDVLDGYVSEVRFASRKRASPNGMRCQRVSQQQMLSRKLLIRARTAQF